MTLKVTERDKKLLVFLAVVVVFVGVGAGVLLPLIDKSQSINQQLIEAKIVKIENEQKVNTLSAIKKKESKLKEELTGLRGEFYEMVPSMEIDRMLTGMALSHGLVVLDLDIEAPVTGSFTVQSSYQDILNQLMQTGTEEEAATEELEGTEYGGTYTAKVTINMSGSRDALQAMLDECAALEPKARVTEFLWEEEKEESAGYILNMSVELYMSESTEQYMSDQMLKDAAEEETDTNTDENAEEDVQ